MMVYRRSNFGEFSGDNSNKFFVADSSISILIGIINHLINFGWGESFSNGVTDSLKVFRAEAVCSLGIKYFV